MGPSPEVQVHLERLLWGGEDENEEEEARWVERIKEFVERQGGADATYPREGAAEPKEALLASWISEKRDAVSLP